MPTISLFFGIYIRMYYDDHNPPHFHAYYNDFHAIIEIATLKVLEGKLPKRALAMVSEWGTAHRQELLSNWQMAETHQPLRQIQPLE